MSEKSLNNKIKQFFKKKKEQNKFKLAGPGRRLNSEDSTPSTSRPKRSEDVYVPPKRATDELTAEAKAAAEAAIARSQQKGNRDFNTSLAAIKAQVKRELEAEKKEKLEQVQAAEAAASQAERENRNLAVQGVYFRCPMISDEILPRKEWKVKIKEFLYEQLTDERGLTAALMIRNCNTKEKAENCIEILTKYIENIINNPNDEKYRKIRLGNKIFCERVKPIEGGYDFLIGAGFVEQIIDNETFLIYSEENAGNIGQLSELLEALHNSEIINIELDRNIQVLLPSQAKKQQLPADFYRISPEELKREQQLRTEAVESAQILKTKAMRERDELRTINKYNFSLIRVRFPDGVFLQGTFSVYEKLNHVMEFVRSCLKDESFQFELASPTGHKFKEEDYDKSLYDLRLVPNCLLTYVYENMLYPTGNYLKEDLLMLIQPV